MRREHVRDLLRQVADGSLDVSHALDALALEPTESLGFATIDHHRALRQGFPEVIYGAGKTPDQICEIARRIVARGDGVLVTRIADDAAVRLADALPNVEVNDVARTAFVRADSPAPRGTGTVAVVTAGTSDLPVAEEAAVTLDALGRLRDARDGRRRSRHSPRAGEAQRADVGVGGDRGGGNGRRAAVGRRRHGARAGDRGADVGRIWSVVRRAGGACSPC